MTVPYSVATNDIVQAADVNQYKSFLEGASGYTITYALTSTSGTNFVIKLGDASGSNKISFQDSAGAEVASINSDGLFTGSLSLASGTLTLPTAASPTPTTEGQIYWDTDDNLAAVGDGAASKIIIPSPTTTAGDIEYASGARAHSRLAIGTAGQVLRVNSGATAPEWADATTYKYKTSTQVFTTTTTYADVTASSGNFAFSIAANEVWLAEYWISVGFGGTGGLKLQLTGPAAPTSLIFAGTRTAIAGTSNTDNWGILVQRPLSETGTFSSAILSADSIGTLTHADDSKFYSGSNTYVHIFARIINGANAGTVTLQAAQNSSNSTTTLSVGSWMRASKIA